MKYKCIKDYSTDTKSVMKEGDIIVSDGTKIYNLTTSMDHNDISLLDICNNLDYISDEQVVELDDIIEYNNDLGEFSDSYRFQKILSEMLSTYVAKNSDYGNSFEESLDEEGLAAARVRMGDKWNRFKTLSKGKSNLVKDESIRDTLLDTANYCIMTIMWLDKQNYANL